MKIIIILGLLLLLFSCKNNLPEGIIIDSNKITNMDKKVYEGKNIIFGYNKDNDGIVIPIDLLEQKYIPKGIETIHLGHGLSEEEILKVFQYDLDFIDTPEIIYGTNALTEKVHDIFVNLDIKQFNGVLLVENNCSAPIVIPKESSDKYFNSKIEKFDIYATCWNDVMKMMDCRFEGYDRDNEKLMCG